MKTSTSSLYSKIDKITSHLFILISSLYLLSFIVIGVFASTLSGNGGLHIWSNLMMVTGATSVCGFILGFLFGIPRSVRFGYNKKDDSASVQKEDAYFADNTNLEEISDWITKIILGVSLIQYQKILDQLDSTAQRIANSVSPLDSNEGVFIFSYSLLILDFGLGFFGAYYWARTKFGSILALGRIDLIEIMNLANRNLSNVTESSITALGLKGIGISIEELRSKVANLLKTTPVVKKDDSQKGRWGGLSNSNSRELRVTVTRSLIPKLFDVTIEVISTSVQSPLEKPVVILLDETFIEDEIYLQPENNVAKVKVVAYEAFTVAALCDDTDTKLELDLQKVKGFPNGFYYQE